MKDFVFRHTDIIKHVLLAGLHQNTFVMVLEMLKRALQFTFSGVLSQRCGFMLF